MFINDNEDDTFQELKKNFIKAYKNQTKIVHPNLITHKGELEMTECCPLKLLVGGRAGEILGKNPLSLKKIFSKKLLISNQ